MKLEKLTVKSQEALQEAQAAALHHGHPEITPVHLLHALAQQEGGLVPVVLNNVGVDVDRLRRRLASRLESGPRVEGGDNPPIGEALRRVVEGAEKVASEFKDDFVSVEHLLLALLDGKSAAADLLRETGVDRSRLLEALKTVRGAQRVTSQSPEDRFQAIEKYARNLT